MSQVFQLNTYLNHLGPTGRSLKYRFHGKRTSSLKTNGFGDSYKKNKYQDFSDTVKEQGK